MSKLKNNKKLKYIFKTLKFTFLIIFLVVVFVSLFSTIFIDKEENKGFLGFHFFIVLSNSMEPEFSAGDLIVARNIDPNKLVVEDIIIFNSIDPFSFNEIITHEIVGITTYEDELAFTTKGIANNQNDVYPVPYDKVIGEYRFNIPKVGYIIDYLKSDSGYIIFILVPFVLLIGLEVSSIIKKMKIEKQKDIERLTKEKEDLEKEIAELKNKKD